MPFYGNLFDRNGQLLREQEELDVEDPGREVLVWENLLCGGAGEQLEAALGIADMTHADNAQDSVEAVHEDVSEERALIGRQRHARSRWAGDIP